jgi:hypothetical protein
MKITTVTRQLSISKDKNGYLSSEEMAWLIKQLEDEPELKKM